MITVIASRSARKKPDQPGKPDKPPKPDKPDKPDKPPEPPEGGIPTHPIILPGEPSHPIVIPEPGEPEPPALGWRPFRIGAGGWVTGMDISPDGATMVCRTDTYGGYEWHDEWWMQLVDGNTMPEGTVNRGGIYELCLAPSDPTLFYMIYGDRLYRSGDTAWEATNVTFPLVDANSPVRMYGQKMAVNPSNPDHVVIGTPDGVRVTYDGGETFDKTEVPASATDVTGIVIWGNIVYACASEHGVWRSVDDGPFEHIGGPINVRHAALDHDGHYLCTDFASLWRFDGSQWTALYTTPGVFGLAVDPHRPGHIITCLDGGSLAQSTDNGATWGDGQNWATYLNSDDIPWLETSGAYMSVGRLMFDPVVPGKLWMSAGVGVWHTQVPDDFMWHEAITWQSQSAGIEQLCSNDILVPPGQPVALAAWDRPVFVSYDPDTFPIAYMPPASFSMGWSLDYASTDPGFLCGLVNYWGSQLSGYTRDGQTWVPFPVQPPIEGSQIGGSIAALSPDNIIIMPANKVPGLYTKDGGNTWAPVVLPDFPNYDSFHWAYYLKRRTVTADRVRPDTAYIYAYAQDQAGIVIAGVYETTDGGDTWAKVYDGEVAPLSPYSAQILAMPGREGELWFSSGQVAAFLQLMRSTDGARTWAPVEGISQPHFIGVGRPGEIVAAAYDPQGANFGIYVSSDDAATWKYLGMPLNTLDSIGCVALDPNIKGRVYVGFGGSGFAYYDAGG